MNHILYIQSIYALTLIFATALYFGMGLWARKILALVVLFWVPIYIFQSIYGAYSSGFHMHFANIKFLPVFGFSWFGLLSGIIFVSIAMYFLRESHANIASNPNKSQHNHTQSVLDSQ